MKQFNFFSNTNYFDIKKQWIIFFILLVKGTLFFAQKATLNVIGIPKNIEYNNQLINPNDLSHIQEKIDSLYKILHKNGYFNLEIDTPKKINDSLYELRIAPANKVRYIFMTPSEELKKTGIEKKITTTPYKYQRTIDSILNKLSKQGALFDQLQLSDIQLIDSLIYGTLNIFSYKKRKIDDVVIKGYEKFPVHLVKYFSKIKTNKPLDLEQLKSESKKLGNLPYLDEIRPPEILFEKDSSTVFIYLKKAKSNFFDGFIGFNTEEETGNFELNGYLDLKLINNINAGEQLEIKWKNDGRQQSSFNLNAEVPSIFKLPLGIEAGLRIFRKDSSFQTTSLSAKLSYLLSPSSKFTLGIINTESNTTLTNITNTEDLSSTFTQAGFLYRIPETNDLFLNRTRIAVEAAIGERKTTTITDNQLTFSVLASNNFWISERSSIFIKSDSAFLNSDQYFDNELFRIGGINSIRGFNENAIEATAYGYLNTEYRYLLTPNSYIHSILDFGFIDNKLTQTENTLYGIGFGLGLQTDSGVFKLNYALGRTNDTTLRLSDSKVHISFVSIF